MKPPMTAAQRIRATYNMQQVDHLCRREFYIWTEALERWKAEGMPADWQERNIFGFDPPGTTEMWNLGWCEPPYDPPMEERVVEDGADYQVIRDKAGRLVKMFKGRRHGFMPTYLKHAVATDADWHDTVLPLLQPGTPGRQEWFAKNLPAMAREAADGRFVMQRCIGGYMYLRALVGPEEICYLFVDNPALVHKMMQAWLELADATAAVAQGVMEIDDLFLAEDICYNHGLLISPDMVREFIFPYYQQLLTNIRARQKRRLFFEVDTDGRLDEFIDLYLEIGMDVMSPVEIAAGNDLLAIAEKYPHLVIGGGIDKRVLADGPAAIDEYLGRVMPYMARRGGYVPTCDHGVPDNVSYASYMHYRKRMMELDN